MLQISDGQKVLCSWRKLMEQWEINCERRRNKKKCYNKIRHERKTKEVNVKKFECAGNPKVLDSISGYTQPYECCNKAITEKVQILNPQLVRYNSDCWENMTEFSQQLTRQHDNRSALFADFQYLSEMGQQVDFAQMEVNTARTRVRLASNQVKLARALLQQQQYAEKSISISKIKDQEQLGIGLANKMKGNGFMITVTNIETLRDH